MASASPVASSGGTVTPAPASRIRGEVLILDMGQPIRILDVAERMIAMSGKEIEIGFTGLRHGEKMHEALVDVREIDGRPFHPSISHSAIPGIRSEDLKDAYAHFTSTVIEDARS